MAKDKFNVELTYSLLPVFFFVLSYSPNISGDRLGLVLFQVYVLLLPALHYIVYHGRNRFGHNGNFLFLDVVVLIMLMAAIYVGWRLSGEYLLMQIIFIVYAFFAMPMMLKSAIAIGYRHILVLVYSLLLYSIIFLGLNHYSVTVLFSLSHLLQVIMASTIVLMGFLLHQEFVGKSKNTKKQLKITKRIVMNLMVMLMLFSVIFILTTKWYYALAFMIVMLPSILMGFNLYRKTNTGLSSGFGKSVRRIKWLLASTLSVFFIYYFLDSTQVLQAILGGY